jgi:phosphoenolpyruvate carboxykinase (ATP)
MVNAALNGELDNVEMRTDQIFGLNIPASCPDVPAAVLDPASTWADKAAYESKATQLAKAFHQNFAAYSAGVAEEILAAGPLAGRS